MPSGLPRRAWDDLRSVRRQVIGFHALMQLPVVAIFTPVIVWIVRWIIATTGDAVISNFDIASFVLSGRGLLAVLVAAACAIALLLAECAGLTWLAGHAIARRPVTLTTTVAHVARTLPAHTCVVAHSEGCDTLGR